MVDLSTKIKEDPLFMIRKSEEEKRKSVVSNPVKVGIGNTGCSILLLYRDFLYRCLR